MQNSKCKMQNAKCRMLNFECQLMANGQWLIAHVHSLIRTLTVGIGISPIQSFGRKWLSFSTFKESRTITAGREFHPAPSFSTAKIIKKENEELKIEKKLMRTRLIL